MRLPVGVGVARQVVDDQVTAIVSVAIASAGASTAAPPTGNAPRFSRTSEPQSAIGGCTPRPRKLRLASSRSA